MLREPEDWASVAERLLAGDRAAVLKVSRLSASLLARWGAYDFRDEWQDLVHDVLLAVITGLRKGSVRSPEGLVGYVAAITRHKLTDRVRAQHRQGGEVAWPTGATDADRRDPPVERIAEVRLLLEKLPEKQRAAVAGVYGYGKTYEEVARETGIPLGTLKRYLRQGLAALRREFSTGG